jgi:hypothetical protein
MTAPRLVDDPSRIYGYGYARVPWIRGPSAQGGVTTQWRRIRRRALRAAVSLGGGWEPLLEVLALTCGVPQVGAKVSISADLDPDNTYH